MLPIIINPPATGKGSNETISAQKRLETRSEFWALKRTKGNDWEKNEQERRVIRVKLVGEKRTREKTKAEGSPGPTNLLMSLCQCRNRPNTAKYSRKPEASEL